MIKLFNKNKKVFSFFVFLVLIVSLFFDIGRYAEKNPIDVDYSKYIEEQSEEDVFKNISLNENEKLIKYSVNDKKMGYIYGEIVQGVDEGETSLPVTAVANINYRFVKWSDGKTEKTRYDKVTENTEKTAIFEYVGFPEINIITPDIKGEITKEYINSAISLSNTNESYVFDNESAKIKVRGNSSSRFEKKSFKIKFSNKQNLLGIGKSPRKDWVLIANHSDQSLLRNYTAYNLANAFDGFEVSFDCVFVHLYLNGEYNGVYLLTEEIETGEGRVEICTDGLNDDIGFLLELDFRTELNSGECIVVDDLKFSIKSDFLTNGQYEYAKVYLQKCNAAIKKGDIEEIKRLLDVDSLIDMYILQEYVKNFDVGFASLYMYIKENGGKLYFGPAWDFDLAMGNDDRLNDDGVEDLFAGKRRGFGIGHEWFILLMENPWFREMAKQRYEELYTVIKSEISNLVVYYLENKEEFEKNFYKWDIFGKQIQFEPENIRVLETHKEHTDYLVNWLEKRNEWLYSYFLSEEYYDKGFFDKITYNIY